jgi:hypothetical protein
MSTVTEAVCQCVEWDQSQADVVRFCNAEGHHKYWRGNKELTSVSKVIRSMWPFKKNFDGVDPVVLDHARERGIRVDTYLSDYIRSGRVRIMAGEWQEVVERSQMVIQWWNAEQRDGAFQAIPQCVLSDDDIAGTADIVTQWGYIMDLKNVAKLDQTYFLQLGAYAQLYRSQYGQAASGGAFIHVTQLKDQPVSVKFVEVDIAECEQDWNVLRAAWDMAQKRVTR